MRKFAAALGVLALTVSQLLAADTQPKSGMDAMDADHQADAKKLVDGGVKFLLSQRNEDGSWSAGPAYKPAMTGLVLKALLGSPKFAAIDADKASREHMENQEIIAKGFEVLRSFRQKDGGFYEPKEGQAAYTTAIAVMALKAANNPAYNDDIRDAVAYLKGLQIQPGQESPDGKKVEANDPRVGGVGYGKPPAFQPNLSVLGFWMEAMEETGVDRKDPAVQRAAEFLTRLQNSKESNTTAVAKEGSEDGGFYYALNESKAGPDGKGLRSYGSMTYVGFKSLLYAGIGKDDPRAQAAFGWVRKYWGLDSNPNMPGAQSKQGLYYYYNAFAKALRAWGEPVITDTQGAKHNWREELVDALKQRVTVKGGWENAADRWEEGSPVLVTAYVVMALEQATK